MGDPILILIVDDHAVVRKGLVMALRLERDLDVIGENETTASITGCASSNAIGAY